MEQQLIEDLIKIRRQLHQNPELGFREIETSKLICRELETLKISYGSGIAQTGIIAQLKKGEGPCIALRADMDALPLEENTILEFKSRNKNVMHACGHDIHVTILLGALRLLEKEDFNGSVKFIFQSSEEGAYDDFWKDRIYKSGGQRIVESGELNDVEACLGLHVNPLLPKGKLAYCLGHALAATGFFKIIITGKGGHAAFPELTVDPLLVATQIINDSH